MAAPKFTLRDFQSRFPDDDSALQYVFDRRFGHLEHCPDCAAKTKFHRIKKRKVFSCQHCGYQLSPLAGTIFEKTTTPLTLWLYVVFIFTSSKNGVSAKEIQRQIGVTYKTAWRMGHKIREAMDESGDIFMAGTVEMDETMMGGRKRGGKRGWGSNRLCVFGMVERGGKIRTVVVPDRKQKTLFPIIVEHVSEDATAYTDEWTGYTHLHREVTGHETVNHKQYEWVRGDVHTQTIEGAWSLRKRSIKGTYTSVSTKYLQNYLNEFDFRTNHRGECLFDVVMENATPPVD